MLELAGQIWALSLAVTTVLFLVVLAGQAVAGRLRARPLPVRQDVVADVRTPRGAPAGSIPAPRATVEQQRVSA